MEQTADNIITANKIGMFGEKVEPDDYNSIINLLKKYNIKF